MSWKSSRDSGGFKKSKFSVETSKNSENLGIWKIRRGRRACSTSYPSGNQVDGSPLVAIAKRVRVGPRTQVHMTLKKLFWMDISSRSGLGSDMIILDNVLKIFMELLKQRNDNAGEKFYLVQAFSKVRNLVENSKIPKNLEILKILSKGALLLYELSEREPG